MKRAKNKIDGFTPKAWMDYMFDHTTLIAEDDPFLEGFKKMDTQDIIQLRIIPATGAEQFAKYIYNKVNEFVLEETNNRVRVTQVEFTQSTQKKVHLTLMILSKYMTKTHTSKK
jgi:6-pyruvoyltetrahydropterin/6-carboxytetrahydropterin synthase